MLATLVSKPFNQPGWTYEEKYDGDRMLAYKEGERVRLVSRNAKDHTARLPHIVEAIRKLRAMTLLLDGEAVVFDSRGVSRFQLLQQGKGEPVYAVFDCLYVDGKDLRGEPLATRRQALERAVTGSALLLSRRLAENGFKAYEIAKRRGHEGIVAKDQSSPYVEKRSKFWLKVKVRREDEFVVAGFTAPFGTRKYFGAVLLGAYEKGKLRYVGKVGTGFDEQALASVSSKFKPLTRLKPAFADPPRDRDVTFLAPKLVAQISYQEWTADRKLRQPVFLGLRDDKLPEEVVFPNPQR